MLTKEQLFDMLNEAQVAQQDTNTRTEWCHYESVIDTLIRILDGKAELPGYKEQYDLLRC